MSGDKKTSGKKPKTKKRKNIFLSLFLCFISFLILFAISSYISYKYFYDPEDSSDQEVMASIEPENGIEVEIPTGSNTDAIANILNEKGIIKHPFMFKFVSKFNGYDGHYKSGKHVVSKELDYEGIMKILCSNPVTTTVTILEGWNLSQLVKYLDDKKVIDKDNFMKVCDTENFEYKFLESVPERENRLEGYLFPDTYFIDPSGGEKEVIRKLLNNFDLKFKPDFYERAKELNMTVDEVIVLASIIEKEAKLPEERRIISSVFHNRLKTKNSSLKKLQSCATVQYILYNTEGKIKEIITEEDTKIKHPYNTYLHEGLPPGPICSPGLAAIEAALYPDEESEYMFFVARGDGSHEFSKTLAEHEAAIKKYEVK